MQCKCYIYHPHLKDGEGNVFTGVCSFTPGRGAPQSQVLSHISVARSFLGGTLVMVWGTPVPSKGVPNPNLGRGYPVPARVYPSIPPSRTGLGYPLGVSPSRTGLPYPHPGQDWCTIMQDRTGEPLPPPSQDRVAYTLLPRQNSRASTCYRAGDMPLALTQEDFLVYLLN